MEGNKKIRKREGKRKGEKRRKEKSDSPSFNTSSYSKRHDADGIILATSVSAETYTCAQTYLLEITWVEPVAMFIIILGPLSWLQW